MPPPSINRFGRFYLGSLVVGSVSFVLDFGRAVDQLAADPATAQLGSSAPMVLIGGFALGMAVSLLLWYLTSRRASNIARWVLTVLTLLGLAMTPFQLSALPALPLLLTVAGSLAAAASLWFLFRADANAWFQNRTEAPGPDVFE